jgi:uncharacterized protein YecE (DUF72 family)
MNFGYISDDGVLDRIDFRLPDDEVGNGRVLAAGKGNVRICVGCAEYRLKEWKELIYPKGTKEGDMLHLYAEQFNVVEMNGTHYRIYPPEHIAKWAAATSEQDFLFLPKFPQIISHESHGYEEMQVNTAAFIESVRAFGPHLGPLFLQMSEWYSPDNRRALFAYLASLPEGFTYFIELRHRDWYTHAGVRHELMGALRAMGIGLVITDTPGHREIVHMALTIPRVMIRFVGRHRHPSTALRADAWIERIGEWMGSGLEEVYFITHTGLSAPRTAKEVIQKMNAAWGVALRAPRLLDAEQLL